MNLPVKNLHEALPFYQRVLGFKVTVREDKPRRSAVLARDGVKIGLVEDLRRDPTQDGCAFHVHGVRFLLVEFRSHGLKKDLSDLTVEERDGAKWDVMFVVAPDGLCYWFGEKQV